MNIISEVSIQCENDVIKNYIVKSNCDETLIDIENGFIKLNKDNVLDSLLYVRTEFEKKKCYILINGSRKNFVVSGMSNQMSGGIKGYTVKLGEPATSDNLVDILAYADPNLVGTIEEQDKFHQEWMESILNR